MRLGLDIPLIVTGGVAGMVEIYRYLLSGQYQIIDGLERLLPEVAVLLLAMVGVRWLVTTYNKTIESIVKRHDDRQKDFIAAINKLSDEIAEWRKVNGK